MIFSIITPSFKQLDWLRSCVASIRDQVEKTAEGGDLILEISSSLQPSSFKPQVSPVLCVEHIIQDAGSPGIEDFAREVGADFYRDGRLVFSSRAEARDESAEPVSQPSTIDPRQYRIAIYGEGDSGMYDAINRGLARASGDLCAYLNCDEQYLPGALQIVSDWFLTNRLMDVLFADALLLDELGNALSYRRTVLPDRWHTRLCHLNTLTCATFFRKSVVDRGFIFPADKQIIGDAIWVHAMLAAGLRMGYLRQATTAFTFTGANLSELDRGEDSEQAMWARGPGSPPTCLRFPVSLWHRIKKGLAGAYLRRTFDYSVFTKASSESRVTRKAHRIPGGWPGQTA